MRDNINRPFNDGRSYHTSHGIFYARMEKAEEEQDSYRRRIKLLEVEFEKTKKTLAEKQERLAHLEGGSQFISLLQRCVASFIAICNVTLDMERFQVWSFYRCTFQKYWGGGEGGGRIRRMKEKLRSSCQVRPNDAHNRRVNRLRRLIRLV